MITTDHPGASQVRIFADHNAIRLTVKSDQNVRTPHVSVDRGLTVNTDETGVIVSAGSNGEISPQILANLNQPAFTVSWRTPPRPNPLIRFLKWLSGGNSGGSSITDSVINIVDDGRPLAGEDHITEFSGSRISTRATGAGTRTVVTDYSKINLTRGRGPIGIIVAVPPGDRLVIKS